MLFHFKGENLPQIFRFHKYVSVKLLLIFMIERCRWWHSKEENFAHILHIKWSKIRFLLWQQSMFKVEHVLRFHTWASEPQIYPFCQICERQTTSNFIDRKLPFKPFERAPFSAHFTYKVWFCKNFEFNMKSSILSTFWRNEPTLVGSEMTKVWVLHEIH